MIDWQRKALASYSSSHNGCGARCGCPCFDRGFKAKLRINMAPFPSASSTGGVDGPVGDAKKKEVAEDEEEEFPVMKAVEKKEKWNGDEHGRTDGRSDGHADRQSDGRPLMSSTVTDEPTSSVLAMRDVRICDVALETNLDDDESSNDRTRLHVL